MFVGPSALGVTRADWDGFPLSLAARGPVERGDVARLVEESEPGTVVVVDGRFHDALAVGHLELREALARGWNVWGVSSMGAIRAYEMRDLGMRGFGQVYRAFFEHDDFQDDEVALLHNPEPPYQPLSEPMVHLRAAVEVMRRRSLLTPASAHRVVRALKERWYGERTVSLLTHLARAEARPAAHSGIEDLLRAFDRFRVKTHDLVGFLALSRGEVLGPVVGGSN